MTLPPPGCSRVVGKYSAAATRAQAVRIGRPSHAAYRMARSRGAATGSAAHAHRISEARREELVDQGQDDQEDEAGAEAPGDQLLLDRQQRLMLGLLELAADIVLRHATCSSERSAGQR